MATLKQLVNKMHSNDSKINKLSMDTDTLHYNNGELLERIFSHEDFKAEYGSMNKFYKALNLTPTAKREERTYYKFCTLHKSAEHIRFSNGVKLASVDDWKSFVDYVKAVDEAEHTTTDVYTCDIKTLQKLIREHKQAIKEAEESKFSEDNSETVAINGGASVLDTVIEVRDSDGNVYAVPVEILKKYKK